ncbi:MAG: response regulator [Sideroxydans sp.]|nr:response regulator [Sideroxydans sp.]
MQRCILVAEDNPANQAVLRMQLESLGCEVDIAADGLQALDKYKAREYDLVMADVNMPHMDGLQLARAIRTAERDCARPIPIIAITAATDSSVMIRCKEAGMDDALPKPIDLDGLLSMLNRWLFSPAVNTPETFKDSHQHAAVDSVAVLDTSILKRVVGRVDAQQLHQFLLLFLDTARKDLSASEQDVASSNLASLALHMHKLKSSSRAVGAMCFYNCVIAMEHAAKNKSVAEIAGLMASLNSAFEELKVEIDRSISTQTQLSGVTTESLPQAVQTHTNQVPMDDFLEKMNRNEFEVCFHPKIDLRSMQMVSVEAALRCRASDELISISSVIERLKDESAVWDFAEIWITKALLSGVCLIEGGAQISLDLPLHLKFLNQDRLILFLLATAQATQFPIHKLRIGLEAEGAMVGLEGLKQLHQKGVEATLRCSEVRALSLCQLSGYTFSGIKMYPNLLHMASADEAVLGTLSKYVGDIHKCHAKVELDGVSTDKELAIARRLGCDCVQGDLFGQALTVEQLLGVSSGRGLHE